MSGGGMAPYFVNAVLVYQCSTGFTSSTTAPIQCACSGVNPAWVCSPNPQAAFNNVCRRGRLKNNTIHFKTIATIIELC